MLLSLRKGIEYLLIFGMWCVGVFCAWTAAKYLFTFTLAKYAFCVLAGWFAFYVVLVFSLGSVRR